jgi:hypothetical protein
VANFGQEVLKDFADLTRPGLFLGLAREGAEKDRTDPEASETMQLANSMNVVASWIAANMLGWPGMDNLAGLADVGFTVAEADAMEVVAAYPNTENPGPEWPDEFRGWQARMMKAARALLA